MRCGILENVLAATGARRGIYKNKCIISEDMSFSFRDKGRLSDRFRGKTCDEILKELREHINQGRNMSFDSSPSWGGFSSGPAFPRAGFPFMDQDMMSRPDMRARFEDLANRHPEFAEHLRPTAWGTVPETDPHFFQSAAPGPSLYRQRHPSGGSGTGAASFSEANAIPIPVIHEDSGGGESGSSRGRTRKIPQYGMRNTVDLGESQKLNPSDTNEDLRSQRSWSAPPDNRTRGEDPQPKRFVTRVDVNNSHSNPGGDNDSANPVSNSSPGKPPPFPKASGPTQQPASKSSNVRHIPIFVEGRDEPVMSKASDSHSFSSSRASSGFGQPNASYAFASAPTGNHSSAFASARSSPGRGWSQASGPHPHGSSPYQPASFSNPNGGVPHPHGAYPPPPPHGSAPHPQGNVPPPQGAADHEPKPEAPVHTPKQIVPKDPIAKVKAIQEEVDELKNLVEKFSGTRNDKEYIYLDEMLTRNLIKLDDIETEGKDNIRQVRKEAIRSIQKCISLLESRAPLPQESKTEVLEESVPSECAMEENNADVGQATQQDTNAGLEVNEVPMEVQEKGDGLDQPNPDSSTAMNDTRMMAEPEKPMEVTRDVQTDEKVGEVSSSSVVENALPKAGGQDLPVDGQDLPSGGTLLVEPSQEAEVMEVVPTAEEKGEVSGEDLTKVKMEVSADGKENESQISIADDGANVISESCDVRPDSVCNNSNKDDNASSAVTEETKVEKEARVVEKVANVPTDNESTETGEAPTVVEEAKCCANEPPIPIKTPNEGSVESKDSEVTVEVGQPSKGDIKSNEAPPSEATSKEVS